MGVVFRYLPKAGGAFNVAYRALELHARNRSLEAVVQAARHYHRRLRGHPSPAVVSMALTYRCQCRCVHCYASSPTRPREDELTTDELRSVIRQVKALGAMTVYFSGGEPLLREDVFELVAYAHELGLLTRVNTNGLLLDERTVRALRDAGLSECDVSLDSADPATHDAFRGVPGLFAKTVAGIARLRRFGVPCRVMTVPRRDAIPDGVVRLKDLARRLGAHALYMIVPAATGEWATASEELLTEADLAKLRDLQDLTFAHLEQPSAETNCNTYRKNMLYVSAKGDVTPCGFVPFALGNVRERPLEQIWREHAARMDLVCCGDCPMNHPDRRAEMKRHVEGVARALAEVGAPR